MKDLKWQLMQSRLSVLMPSFITLAENSKVNQTMLREFGVAVDDSVLTGISNPASGGSGVFIFFITLAENFWQVTALSWTFFGGGAQGARNFTGGPCPPGPPWNRPWQVFLLLDLLLGQRVWNHLVKSPGVGFSPFLFSNQME